MMGSNASSVFAGKAAGESNVKEYKRVLQISNVCTITLSGLLMVLLLFFSNHLPHLFTNLDQIIHISVQYRLWLILFPPAIGIGLVYYGIFSGCTFTTPIRNSMLISLFLFITAYMIFVPIYGNHGLWFSFILFSLGRSFVLFYYEKKMFQHVFKTELNSGICN